MKLFGILLMCLAILSCSSKPSRLQGDAGEISDLTQEQAKDRKNRLSDIQYDLRVVLNDTDSHFRGSERIEFQLKDNAQPLLLDFLDGQTTSIRLNGSELDAASKHPAWIELPARRLHSGHNLVEIEYSAEYSRQGTGLHRFKDPETQDVFLYTHFEPFDAHRFFPCFDQPDLRSVLHLKVQAPSRWQVISTTMETEVQNPTPEVKVWNFAPTPPLATYLFSMHAGPYKVWRDQYEDIPLRLFVRPSMEKYVDAKEWMSVTQKGLKFFNDYFGVNYPFKKYDQVIVPESNSGAMENVGAVTFNEHYLHRSAPTRDDRRALASTILHEMAHMWFGDLVTMAWWNDLWLNESFATFMATLALHEGTDYKEAWQALFNRDKVWAYWEDSLVTTHPIEAPVHSVRQAFANFDGITYGKGAAVLEQLRYYIGPEAFKQGIRQYIRDHSYQNTELKDFMAALQAKTQKDLSLWSKAWLQQSGTDSLAVNWTCEGSRLKQIQVSLTPSEGAQFRPQAVEIGLFRRGKGAGKGFQSIPVDMESATQTIQGNWSCPQFVYPNLQDYGYASVVLDPVSLAYAKQHLMEFADPLLRNMLWHDLWEMVRTVKMPLKDYVQVIETQFPKENNTLILGSVRNTISGYYREQGSLLQFWPQETAAERKSYRTFVEKTEEQYLRRFQTAKAGSDEQKFWFDSYVSVARTSKGLNQLKKWFTAPANAAPGFTIDLDRRWNILRQLVRFEEGSWTAKIADLKKEDASDRGVRQALAAEAIQPNAGAKEKWMSSLTQTSPTLSLAEARTVMGALFPLEQTDLSKTFDTRFYDYVRANSHTNNDAYLHLFAGSLAPLSCDPTRSAKLKDFLSQQDFLPTVSKALKVDLQEDERCQKVRKKSGLE